MPEPGTAEEGSDLPELEDLSEPLSEDQLPTELPAETFLIAPDGRTFHISHLLYTSGARRVYVGSREPEGDQVWIHEAWNSGDLDPIENESEILGLSVASMFPRQIARWKQDGKSFLVTDLRTGPRLDDVLREKQLSLTSFLSSLAQVAFAIGQLHRRGWVHLGLRPGIILLGRPTSVIDFSDAVRVGEKPRRSFYHSGYSPPEVLACDPADPRSDIYAIGALLFHFVSGSPVAETGAALLSWMPPKPVAGAPQVLQKCLGTTETRYNKIEDLHRDLLALIRRSSPAVRHVIASASTIGLEPTRTSNQDASGYLTGCSETDEGRQCWSVLGLADGMGGMEAGEVASATAVQTILSHALEAMMLQAPLTSEERSAELKCWIASANERVCGALAARGSRGGTTIVCATIIDKYLVAGYVGDSRLYVIRNGACRPLTRDHSLAMAMALQGEIPVEEIRHHADRNKVTRSLGERPILPSYYVDTLEPCTGSVRFELQSGDTVLLCTDGVWEPLEDATIAAIVQGSDPANSADALLASVLERGAPDNATVVILQLTQTLGGTEEHQHDSL